MHTDTSHPVPEVQAPPHPEFGPRRPRREPGGQTSTFVPEVGLARGVVTALHRLAGLHGLHISRRRG